MKKFALLFAIPLLLTSCNSNSSQAGNSDKQSDESSTSIFDDGTNTNFDPIEEDDGFVVSFIHLDQTKKYLQKGKTFSITYQFIDRDGNVIDYDSLSEEECAVSWTSSDESIATVSKYGVVSAKKAGKVFITIETLYKTRKARCVFNIVNSMEDLHTEFRLVENDDISTLSAGDVLVFGVPSKGVTATSEITAGDLCSVTSTFSSDGKTITSLNTNAAQFMLDGSGAYNDWSFETSVYENGKNKQQYLCAFSSNNRVGFVNKTGNIKWEIGVDPDDNKLYIQSAANIAGWMMYNSDTTRFSLYTSNETQFMKLVNIYRETIVE